ncbi:hypothetical protein GOV04_01185 [Candidatus Woesearchaeota archaeon]|nr:hypothetical protein [Candidatus Woesearchaeota archaeon]
MIELGGNIVLKGFKELDPPTMMIVRKLVGNHARKISDKKSFEQLSITLKLVHQKEKSAKHEVKIDLNVKNKVFNSEAVDYNLFFSLDKALQKLESQIKK